MKRPIAVTGVGMLTSLGTGVADNWQRLLAGHSGVERIRRFGTDGLPVQIAACVDWLPRSSELSILDRAIAMGDIVVDEALSQAGLSTKGDFDGGFFIAPPVHDCEWPGLLQAARPDYQQVYEVVRRGFAPLAQSPQTVPLHYARRHGLRRLPLAVTTACASGGSALQLGVEAIRRGECSRAIALGAEAPVRPEMIARFSLLSALSTRNEEPQRASRPFSADRDGFVMGEGAAALVLEDPEVARARGAKVLAYVLGCGEAGDNSHRTRSNPSGGPIVECMRRALQDAGLDRSEVDYVNAHGTGTPENDRMESRGIHQLFGERAGSIPVSSIKSMIGHTLSAAGALEAACTVMSLVTGMLPPTINHAKPDPEVNLDVVPNRCRPTDVRVALSNSFGFGGQNVSIAFGRVP
jgi:3-oxoacyl-[acyl-carrier-protein] synthase II